MSYEPIADSPSIPITQDEAIEQILDNLHHLSKFKCFEVIDN